MKKYNIWARSWGFLQLLFFDNFSINFNKPFLWKFTQAFVSYSELFEFVYQKLAREGARNDDEVCYGFSIFFNKEGDDLQLLVFKNDLFFIVIV